METRWLQTDGGQKCQLEAERHSESDDRRALAYARNKYGHTFMHKKEPENKATQAR